MIKAGFAVFALLGSCPVMATEPASSAVSTEIKISPDSAAKPAPDGPDSATLAEEYFSLGNWRIGMPRDEALKLFGDLSAIEGDTAYRAVAHTRFAQDLPAEIAFADGRLKAVKVQVYQGTDFDAGVSRMQSALLYMNDHFGGANFEGGLKTWKDPNATLLRQVLKQSIDQMEFGARAADKKDARKRKNLPVTHTAFELVMNFGTELASPNNFLLGEFRFISNLQEFTINLYDDGEFVKARIPDASVMLFRAEGDRPTSPAPATP